MFQRTNKKLIRYNLVDLNIKLQSSSWLFSSLWMGSVFGNLIQIMKWDIPGFVLTPRPVKAFLSPSPAAPACATDLRWQRVKATPLENPRSSSGERDVTDVAFLRRVIISRWEMSRRVACIYSSVRAHLHVWGGRGAVAPSSLFI